MRNPCPRIVIAGASSGVGKTSVTLALIQSLRKKGLKVQPFKVGPDFLDPTYLSLAAGRACYNLDSWMSDPSYVKNLFVEKSKDADIAVIEGVMGLFDGADADSSSGSTAEIAKLLDAPVLFVVDAKGMAMSIAPLVKGFATFEKGVKIGGVIANRIGSQKHLDWLKASLESAQLPPLSGGVEKGGFPVLPSRHLGLITANREKVNEELLEKLSAGLEKHTDIELILAIARKAPSMKKTVSSSQTKEKWVRLGVAMDEAFHFYYKDTLEAFADEGCEIIEFSLLEDDSLPESLDALYIGGGYPEEYAERLSSNAGMLSSIRSFVKAGGALYAECGGLIYLSEGVETLDGKFHEFAGLIPSRAKMFGRFKSLGYVEAVTLCNSLLGRKGTALRGHRFHYSEFLAQPDGNEWSNPYRLKKRRDSQTADEGWFSENIFATYVHAHLASNKKVIESILNNCGVKK